MPKQFSPRDRSVTVAEWPKRKNEVVRVSLEKFRGREMINIRVWFTDEDGTLQPGRNGIGLTVTDHLREIRKALRKAEEIITAREGGNND